MAKKNTYKEKEKEQVKRGDSSRFSVLRGIVSGDVFSQDTFLRNIPFIVFLSFLGILYIGNGYRAIGIIREISKVNTELKELRSEYITIKSELNYNSKQSQVAEKAAEVSVVESNRPPKKIELTSEEAKNVTDIKE